MRRLALLGALLAAALSSSAGASSPGPWSWPLPGQPVVERGFEPPKTQWGAGHRGVDLLGYDGEPVLAAGPGRITYAGLLAGRGVVVVQHDDGLRTTYEPVTAAVAVGDLVGAGDQVGALDPGHASCPPRTTCLHWGLLRGPTYLDPLALVARGRLRLLPFDRSAHLPAQAPETTAGPRPTPAPRTARAGGAHSPDRSAGPAAALTGAGVLAGAALARRRRTVVQG